MSTQFNYELWEELKEEGKKNQSHKEINVLDRDDINTVLATMDFFGASRCYLQQTHFDLLRAKYRVFDWLAMGVMGRNDDSRRSNNTCLKVLIYAFKQANYNEKIFIDNLRYNDYDIDRDWAEIKIDL